MHRTAYVTTTQHNPTARPPAASASASASSSPAAKPKATVFAVTCVLHSMIALFCGSMMMFHSQAIYSLGHGTEAAERLLGSTPRDRLLIGTSDSFAGLLLFAIGLLLLMVSHIQDREFQSFFAKGCFGLHVLVGAWRVRFEAGVEGLAGDCLRRTVGDILLAVSWVFVLVYSWIEKYD